MTIFWENVKGENVTTRYAYTTANNYVKQTKKTRQIASPQITGAPNVNFRKISVRQTI